MPRQEHILTVLVASPSDVAEERELLEELVKRHNITWANEFGIRLELVRWETHGYPGVSSDAQAVLNEQLPDDYDIFIGIMWAKFGTPTGRAGSGTEEEVNHAKRRFDADASSVAIMFYFKDAPIPPSQIDGEQLSRVHDFKESLGEEGVLHWTFSDTRKFEEFVQMHLARQVQEFRRRLGVFSAPSEPLPAPPEPSSAEPSVTEDTNAEELGLLDLVEIFEDRFAKLKEIAERIAEATADLGSTITDRSEAMDQLPRDSQGNVNKRALRRIVRQASSDMDHYSASVESDLPLFSHNLSEGIDALTRAASLSIDFASDGSERQQTEEALQAMSNLRTQLAESIRSIESFRDVTARLPRLTSELNRAKRRMASVLDQVVVELTAGDKLLVEGELILSELLDHGELGDKDV